MDYYSWEFLIWAISLGAMSAFSLPIGSLVPIPQLKCQVVQKKNLMPIPASRSKSVSGVRFKTGTSSKKAPKETFSKRYSIPNGRRHTNCRPTSSREFKSLGQNCIIRFHLTQRLLSPVRLLQNINSDHTLWQIHTWLLRSPGLHHRGLWRCPK